MAKAKTAEVIEFGSAEVGDNSKALERAVESALDEIKKIEMEQAKIDAINDEAKTKKAPHSDTIAELKKKCRDDYAIEAKPLAIILAKRRQERRIKARVEALKDNARDQMDMFLQFEQE